MDFWERMIRDNRKREWARGRERARGKERERGWARGR